MHNYIAFLRPPAVALTLLTGTVPAFGIDISNLPILQDGDISISNDTFQNFSATAKPDQCNGVLVDVAQGETTAIRCPGATNVKVYFRVRDAAGVVHERRQELDVNNHYLLGWDDELKAYIKLIPMFDSQGRMTR